MSNAGFGLPRTHIAQRSCIVIATFRTLHGATAALTQLEEMRIPGLVDFENAAAITRTEAGSVEVLKTEALPAGQGVGGGDHIAGILGLVFPTVATNAAARPGFAARLQEAGFEDDDLHALAEDLEPGTSLLVAVIDPKRVALVDDILNEVAVKIGWAVMDAVIANLVQQHGAAHPW